MVATEPSDNIHDFLICFAQFGGDQALSARRGATGEEVERFATLARLPLPPLYRGFLLEFGGDDGQLLRRGDDADPCLGPLIAFYEEQAAAGNREIPRNGVVIAIQGLSGARALWYRSPDGEPSVGESWWGAPGRTRSATFRNYLYQVGFIWARFPLYQRYPILFRNDLQLMPEVLAFVTHSGFEPYWFSDEYQVCLEREEISMLLRRDDISTLLYLNGPKKQQLNQVKATLMTKLGLKDATPR